LASEEKRATTKGAAKPAAKNAKEKAAAVKAEAAAASAGPKKSPKARKGAEVIKPAELVSRRRVRENLSHTDLSKVKQILEVPVPNLLDIQKQSYDWFISKGLTDTYREISPVEAFTHNLVLEFVSHRFEPPTYTVEECKRRDVTYSSRLHINVKLINKNTSEIVQQEVFEGTSRS